MKLPGLGEVYGAITAYRAWSVPRTPGDYYIAGRTMSDHHWPRGEPMKACCLDNCTDLTDLVSLDHIPHGIYALKVPSPAMLHDAGIMGEVALWGEIIEHEHGYRAEFAYPIRFYHVFDADKDVAAAYDVELVDVPIPFARKMLRKHYRRPSNGSGFLISGGGQGTGIATQALLNTVGNNAAFAGLAGATGGALSPNPAVPNSAISVFNSSLKTQQQHDLAMMELIRQNGATSGPSGFSAVSDASPTDKSGRFLKWVLRR